MAPREINALGSLIRTRAQLLASGASDRGITQGVRAGALLRLSRGFYLRVGEVADLSPEDRHVLQILAVARSTRTDFPFAGHSAASLHRLPLFQFRSARPLVLIPNRAYASSTRCVERRVSVCTSDDLTRASGIRCTSLERTVLDLARHATPERAIVCADAAARARIPEVQGRVPWEALREWQDALLGRLRGYAGHRGVRRAADIVRAIDGGAESPLESVARWRFINHGYAVDTQVPVPSPNGGTYRVDLELRGFGILCEVDGRAKYTSADLRSGRTADEIVYAEKRRADWIEGTTGKRIVRIAAPELVSDAAFRAWLVSFRIPAPPP